MRITDTQTEKLLFHLFPQIQAIAYKLRKRGIFDYDDLKQIIIYGILKTLKEKPEATSSYLLQAGKDYCRNSIRKETLHLKDYISPIIHDREEKEILLFDFIPSDEDIEEEVAFEVLLDEINSLLTPRQRQILSLYLSGYTQEEISKELRISQRAVEKHFQKIRKAVRKILF